MFWLWPNVCPDFTLLFVHQHSLWLPFGLKVFWRSLYKNMAVWSLSMWMTLLWSFRRSSMRTSRSHTGETVFVPFITVRTFSRVRKNFIITEGQFGLQPVVLHSAIRHKAKKTKPHPVLLRRLMAVRHKNPSACWSCKWADHIYAEAAWTLWREEDLDRRGLVHYPTRIQG